jgi:hypothetical protein
MHSAAIARFAGYQRNLPLNAPSQPVLDIHQYSFREMLDLLGLPDSTRLTETDMRRAKHLVLKTHPDKSGLASEYFLFYKRVYEVVLETFLEQERTSRPVPTTPVVYDTAIRGAAHADRRGTIGSSGNDSVGGGVREDKTSDPRMQQALRALGEGGRFQETFNTLFEKHMDDPARRAAAAERTQWFRDEAADLAAAATQQKASSISGVHDQIERLKAEKAQQALALYRGVQDLGGTSLDTHRLYDDEDAGDANHGAATYASCDPFAKLKYDDLRKVHKDQTVFMVVDDGHRPQYASHTELQQARAGAQYTPLQEAEAERMLAESQRAYTERMQRLEHAAKLQTMQYDSKNQAVRAHFMRLTDGNTVNVAAATHPVRLRPPSPPPPRRVNCPRTMGR